ncbi:MAG TPA: hypothetical protein VK819_08075 [Acidobacteriaceae bacterium]|jgi:hypothetical protein|nr:hypothetical protein [Acidobacteriaceae bacterium]
MSHRRLAVLVAVLALGLPGAFAQNSAWVPEGMSTLGSNAIFHTDIMFNQSMIHAMAQSLPDDEKPIAAKLKSVTVHTYRYAAPGQYDPAALEAVRAQVSALGWEHVITHHPQAKPAAAPTADAAPHDLTNTDVWIHTGGENVDGAIVLVANAKNIHLVYVDGIVSPLDILHLRGKLGIPKFNDDAPGAEK